MPPPRLVKRNSKSELRNVSTFSEKIGTDSAPGDAGSGVASGEGEGSRTAGVAVGDVCPAVVVTGARLGAICFARYISHTTSPTTQRATTIHAVRSINSVLHDQTQRRTSFSDPPAQRGGTGSYPHPPHGWQRARRFNPSQLPCRTPCVSTASRKYLEQLGVNRQPQSGPQSRRSNGESVHW
jgi:hypothetical protein